jgi:hypothetical protein
VLGPDEALLRALEAQLAQGEPEDLVGGLTEQVRPEVEEVGSHPDELASLAREQDSDTHSLSDSGRPALVTT